RISVGVGENQLSIDLDGVTTDPQRQRYEAFCVPEGASDPGSDAGATSPPGGGASPALDAGALGDAGLDAGGSVVAPFDAGGPDVNAAPAEWFTELLRVGERPPLRFSCGRANAVSRTLRTNRLANNVNYAVAVSGQDALGNAGPISEIQCGRPLPLRDFFEDYHQAGGPGGGGFCTLRLGQLGTAASALGAATLALAAL